jgi:hypothetical protein
MVRALVLQGCRQEERQANRCFCQLCVNDRQVRTVVARAEILIRRETIGVLTGYVMGFKCPVDSSALLQVVYVLCCQPVHEPVGIGSFAQTRAVHYLTIPYGV